MGVAPGPRHESVCGSRGGSQGRHGDRSQHSPLVAAGLSTSTLLRLRHCPGSCRGHGALVGTRLGQGCCGSRRTEKKSPQRSAQVGAAPEGRHSRSPRALPALLCASSPGTATGGTILAAARQEAAPASPQPHAAPQVPPSQAPGQNQPHFLQLSQQQHQHQTLRPPARLTQAGKNHSNQSTQAVKEPRAWGSQHKEVQRELWGCDPGGCCSDTPPALSPHPAPKHHQCQPGPRLSFCSQSARREEMAMVAARQDGAVRRQRGDMPGRERGES